MPHLLIVDDDEVIRETLQELLTTQGHTSDLAADAEQAQNLIKRNKFDLVLTDVKMPKMDGFELLTKLQENHPEVPVIIITGHSNEGDAVQAVKSGAYDYLPKPLDMNKLFTSVRNALERSDLVVENKKLKRKITKTREIIGKSTGIMRIKDTIERVAKTEARVLITGENGTGKELVARWLHEKSNRADGPLIEVNCAAIPSELIESELFGHEKGSFTSAIKQRLGKFELANGGTLFLDEIGDMSLAAQAKVLRALQENKITRVGGDKEISVDVRVIAATNKDLFSEISEGQFREDLYHRLAVIVMHVPALRERIDDIPLLAQSFLDEIKSEYGMTKKDFAKDALPALQRLSWTGNIRELNNVIERLSILSGDKITAEDVELYARPGSRDASSYSPVHRFSTKADFLKWAEEEWKSLKGK